MANKKKKSAKKPPAAMAASSGSAAPGPTLEDANRSLAILLQWMDGNGIKIDHDLIEIQTYLRPGGFCFRVVAKQDLDYDMTVCTIPKEAILSWQNCGIADILEPHHDVPDKMKLVLAIMFEQSQGEKSPWWGYLQSLPVFEPIPLLWPADDVKELTAFYPHDQTQDVVLGRLEQHLQPILQAHPTIFAPAEFFSMERSLSIASLIKSRAFEVDDYHGDSMVPLADLFNHKSGAENVRIHADRDVCVFCGSNGGCECEDIDASKSEGEYEGAMDEEWEDVDDTADDMADDMTDDVVDEEAEGNDEDADDADGDRSEDGRSVDQDSDVCPSELDDPDNPLEEFVDSLEMIVVNPCAKGDEVFNTYGDISNGELLLNYGFVEANNPFDAMHVELDDIVKGFSDRLSDADARARVLWWFAKRAAFKDILFGPDDCHDEDCGCGHDHDDDPHDHHGSHDHDHCGGECEDECNDDDSDDEDEFGGHESDKPFTFNVDGHASIDFIVVVSLLMLDKSTFKMCHDSPDVAAQFVAEIVDRGPTLTDAQPSIKSPGSGKKKGKSQADKMATAVRLKLAGFARRSLEQFPSRFEEDGRILKTLGDKVSNRRWILMHRMGSRQILGAALKNYS
ncbi:uncharacterized protein BJ171DRAFT_603962 [Polychytrium aggregatum]|uniref:uncharacterized protein n=1 Tax=Polychytrium aggregatum TaxID=110093 RepID=UPI0022FE1C53|nr:uncharacterized protein BJ171DRAFT_603962 [Polychytrium aggregatum]KAI9193259.1 hypothetical protein BJ171DRAFT_603962 [Polychytrium aggregatum]